MTKEEKAIRDFCGHHADWWPSITQVQEMLALAQPEQEPVAIRYDFDGHGYQYIDFGSGSDWQTRVKGELLYTTPPKRKPFNHHEFGCWWFEYGSGLFPLEGEDQEEHAYRVANAAWQAAHGIKGD